MTAENTTTTTTTTTSKTTKNNNHKNNDNNESHEEKPGLLPPQALPTPPPPPPPTQDTSTLLSPWWSEEPPTTTTTEATIEAESGSTHTATTTTAATNSTINAPSLEQNESPNATTLAAATVNKKNTTATVLTEKEKQIKKPDPNILNISLLSFGRSSPKDSSPDHQWKERCILLATTTELLPKRKKKQQDNNNSNNVQKELEEIFDKSKECSMICFLRSSRQMTRDRLLEQHNGDESKLPMTFAINPFYGTWISVAKTPIRCKEHLLNAGNITRKSFPDYYTKELGEELSQSGEYVTRAVKKTFSPLQHLTQRYLDSWKDGNQQAFFSKFWSSVQKGDAFYLVKDSTKRLIENALGHDKNDKK